MVAERLCESATGRALSPLDGTGATYNVLTCRVAGGLIIRVPTITMAPTVLECIVAITGAAILITVTTTRTFSMRVITAGRITHG